MEWMKIWRSLKQVWWWEIQELQCRQVKLRSSQQLKGSLSVRASWKSKRDKGSLNKGRLKVSGYLTSKTSREERHALKDESNYPLEKVSTGYRELSIWISFSKWGLKNIVVVSVVFSERLREWSQTNQLWQLSICSDYTRLFVVAVALKISRIFYHSGQLEVKHP